MARSRHNAPVGPRRQKRMREHGHGISRRGVEKPEARTDWLPGANKAERNDQRKAAAARLSPLLPVGKRLPARGSRQALPRERRCQRSMRPMRRELAGAQEQSAAQWREKAGASFSDRTGRPSQGSAAILCSSAKAAKVSEHGLLIMPFPTHLPSSTCCGSSRRSADMLGRTHPCRRPARSFSRRLREVKAVGGTVM